METEEPRASADTTSLLAGEVSLWCDASTLSCKMETIVYLLFSEGRD